MNGLVLAPGKGTGDTRHRRREECGCLASAAVLGPQCSNPRGPRDQAPALPAPGILQWLPWRPRLNQKARPGTDRQLSSAGSECNANGLTRTFWGYEKVTFASKRNYKACTPTCRTNHSSASDNSPPGRTNSALAGALPSPGSCPALPAAVTPVPPPAPARGDLLGPTASQSFAGQRAPTLPGALLESHRVPPSESHQHKPGCSPK